MRDESVFLNPRIRFFLNYISPASHNRPRYAASMLQLFISRIDDGIHFVNCDVTLRNVQGLTG